MIYDYLFLVSTPFLIYLIFKIKYSSSAFVSFLITIPFKSFSIAIICTLFWVSCNSITTKKTSDTCDYGDRSCIEDIRVKFKNTGKDIVGEQYIGDGIFEIQFIEYGRGTFNASVIVDCECNISSTKVTRL